ncbi:hypothetical protein A1Q2_00715 [Trichosporon asahii var. asahii CBS 8904]|uniref:Uncharacterized protein n=1 Tax=Trichosporon asahii var. asahii (strain CBS 8904) TaxID=1220162 RepID=K1WVZ9_TRIAC|nr:hypothetical protein A1Q2_00715 [Trichosporon asahii var. asahii CBS 8904]
MDQNFIDLSKSPSIGQQSTLPTPEPAAPGPRVNYNSAVTPLFASAEFGGLNPAVSPSASILKSPPSPTSSASLGAGSGGLLSKFKLRLLRSPKRNGGIVNPKSPLLTSPTSAANARGALAPGVTLDSPGFDNVGSGESQDPTGTEELAGLGLGNFGMDSRAYRTLSGWIGYTSPVSKSAAAKAAKQQKAKASAKAKASPNLSAQSALHLARQKGHADQTETLERWRRQEEERARAKTLRESHASATSAGSSAAHIAAGAGSTSSKSPVKTNPGSSTGASPRVVSMATSSELSEEEHTTQEDHREAVHSLSLAVVSGPGVAGRLVSPVDHLTAAATAARRHRREAREDSIDATINCNKSFPTRTKPIAEPEDARRRSFDSASDVASPKMSIEVARARTMSDGIVGSSKPGTMSMVSTPTFTSPKLSFESNQMPMHSPQSSVYSSTMFNSPKLSLDNSVLFNNPNIKIKCCGSEPCVNCTRTGHTCGYLPVSEEANRLTCQRKAAAKAAKVSYRATTPGSFVQRPVPLLWSLPGLPRSHRGHSCPRSQSLLQCCLPPSLLARSPSAIHALPPQLESPWPLGRAVLVINDPPMVIVPAQSAMTHEGIYEAAEASGYATCTATPVSSTVWPASPSDPMPVTPLDKTLLNTPPRNMLPHTSNQALFQAPSGLNCAPLASPFAPSPLSWATLPNSPTLRAGPPVGHNQPQQLKQPLLGLGIGLAYVPECYSSNVGSEYLSIYGH